MTAILLLLLLLLLCVCVFLGFSIKFAVIEQLPNELRERFTEMREMDLQVQSKYTN